MTEDEKYMKEALRQAKKALSLGEVPIGCVIVRGNEIIARGYNRRNTDKNTLSHAELNAIRKASRRLGDWRLEDCTMYITLEPCQMCAGAIVQARIPRVVLGSMNPKAGCAGSVLNILQTAGFNHQTEITKGVLFEECSEMLGNFFRNMREKQRQASSSKTFLKRLRDQLPGYQVEEGKPEDMGISLSEVSPDKRTYAILYKKGKRAAAIDFVEDYPEEGTGFFRFIWMEQELKGKGVGYKLVRHFVAAAEAVGMERLQLGLRVSGTEIDFWKDCGFEAADTAVWDEKDLLVMEKKI